MVQPRVLLFRNLLQGALCVTILRRTTTSDVTFSVRGSGEHMAASDTLAASLHNDPFAIPDGSPQALAMAAITIDRAVWRPLPASAGPSR